MTTVRADALKPGDRIIDSDGVGATILEARSLTDVHLRLRTQHDQELSIRVRPSMRYDRAAPCGHRLTAACVCDYVRSKHASPALEACCIHEADHEQGAGSDCECICL